ncbi:MAG: hypothetical protein K0R57_6012 [Paenibacillaceae bacterium]|jgi:uncharacterized MnhB-related membrane protein|nr:hypothetical protein [Paenibacillaceae bacterium]
MYKLLLAIKRINLLIAFTVLFVLHLAMYYLLHTEDWITVALSAAFVDTAVLSALQLYANFKTRAK